MGGVNTQTAAFHWFDCSCAACLCHTSLLTTCCSAAVGVGRGYSSTVGRLSDRHVARFGFDSPVRQGIFLSESTFGADSLIRIRTPLRAIACINIGAHVRDHIVRVRIRWVLEALKHPACTVGWVARLCRSWLSPGKEHPNFSWEESNWDNTIVKSY